MSCRQLSCYIWFFPARCSGICVQHTHSFPELTAGFLPQQPLQPPVYQDHRKLKTSHPAPAEPSLCFFCVIIIYSEQNQSPICHPMVQHVLRTVSLPWCPADQKLPHSGILLCCFRTAFISTGTPETKASRPDAETVPAGIYPKTLFQKLPPRLSSVSMITTQSGVTCCITKYI